MEKKSSGWTFLNYSHVRSCAFDNIQLHSKSHVRSWKEIYLICHWRCLIFFMKYQCQEDMLEFLISFLQKQQTCQDLKRKTKSWIFIIRKKELKCLPALSQYKLWNFTTLPYNHIYMAKEAWTHYWGYHVRVEHACPHYKHDKNHTSHTMQHVQLKRKKYFIIVVPILHIGCLKKEELNCLKKIKINIT